MKRFLVVFFVLTIVPVSLGAAGWFVSSAAGMYYGWETAMQQIFGPMTGFRLSLGYEGSDNLAVELALTGQEKDGTPYVYGSATGGKDHGSLGKLSIQFDRYFGSEGSTRFYAGVEGFMANWTETLTASDGSSASVTLFPLWGWGFAAGMEFPLGGSFIGIVEVQADSLPLGSSGVSAGDLGGARIFAGGRYFF